MEQLLEHAGAACVINDRGSFGASQLPQAGVRCVLHFQIQGRSSGFFPRHHMFPPFCFSTLLLHYQPNNLFITTEQSKSPRRILAVFRVRSHNPSSTAQSPSSQPVNSKLFIIRDVIEASSTDVTRTVSYAEIAAKGPKQTPEEVSTTLLASPTIIPHLVPHVRL